MRLIAASLALLAGCDFEGTHACADGYLCPSHLECVDPAIYQHCALPANIDQCHGAADYGTCNYFNNSGIGFEGACRGGVCVQCQNAPDLDGCNVGQWTPMTALEEDLTSVWVAGRGDAYAGGVGGTLFHYDGLTWASVTTFPFAVTSLAGGDAMHVFGLTGDSEVFRYDGMAFTTITPSPKIALKALWAAGPDSLYAAGVDTVVHYDGQTWTSSYTGSAVLGAISGTSATNVFAAGNAGAILHFDGTWTAEASGVTTRTLTAIAAADPANAFAVGLVNSNDSVPTILQLAQGTWLSPQMQDLTALLATNLWAAWSIGAADVYVAGEQGQLFHYTGTWSRITTNTGETIKAIAGSGANDVFAVGTKGTVLHLSD